MLTGLVEGFFGAPAAGGVAVGEPAAAEGAGGAGFFTTGAFGFVAPTLAALGFDVVVVAGFVVAKFGVGPVPGFIAEFSDAPAAGFAAPGFGVVLAPDFAAAGVAAVPVLGFVALVPGVVVLVIVFDTTVPDAAAAGAPAP